MKYIPVPVVIWRDAAGIYTGNALTDTTGVKAVGSSVNEVTKQLQEFLSWSPKHRDLGDGEKSDPKLQWFEVSIRPRYNIEGRLWRCRHMIPLRLPCVTLSLTYGLWAVLPTLDTGFFFHEDDNLQELVSQSVQGALEGANPLAAARHLPPEEVTLDVLRIRRQDENKQKRTYRQPILEAVADYMGDRAWYRRFSAAWGRDTEVGEVKRFLGEARTNVLLLGDRGVGKTTVLAQAVRALVGDDREKQKETGAIRRFWQTRPGRIIAGMRYLGEWEERCEGLIRELAGCKGFLAIDNLLDLVRTGGSEPSESIANFMKPYLARNELHLVVEATHDELEACKRNIPGFVDLFRIVNLPPFDQQTALQILTRECEKQADRARLEWRHGTVKRIYDLFKRFQPYEGFPGRIIGFPERCFKRVKGKKDRVDPADVAAAFSEQTGLPEFLTEDDQLLEHGTILDFFRNRVIGQDHACQVIADVVATFKAGVNDPGKPVAVLLFCGPTGVGKTELAKTLADYLFGHGEERNQRLIRLDMSEYAEMGASLRLLGNPYDKPSDFVRKVRRQPFSVVLLDEIEKASADVFDVLLALMDEGRLTDALGRQTHFGSSVVIMTSNVGASSRKSVGFGEGSTRGYQQAVLSFFRPEFVNRISRIVTFDTLREDAILRITEMELERLKQREGFTRAGLKLIWTPEVPALLTTHGYDSRYGARPLQRTIEERVVSPLSRFLVNNPDLEDCSICLVVDEHGRIRPEIRR